MTDSKKNPARPGSENLVTMRERSKEEARALGKKGGIASGKTRRERKTFRELFNVALAARNEQLGCTNAEAIVAAMIGTALDGDTKAFLAIRDTIGEKPVEMVTKALSGDVTFKWGEKKDE